MHHGITRIDPSALLSWCASLLLLATGVGFALFGVLLGISAAADDGMVCLTLGCSILCLSAASAGSYLLRQPGYVDSTVRAGNHVARR